MSDKRKCDNCIHRDACQDWTIYPLDSWAHAAKCRFYKEEEDTVRTCSFGDGVTICPDGVHELSPHKYELTEKYKNVTVEVLTCKDCGDVSIAWYRQDNTEDITDE